jgi:hypothetical protein
MNALEKIKKSLSEDPRIETILDKKGPRDFLFSERVVHWIHRLTQNPSEPLLLAAWGHDLYRWRLARGKYPMTTPGYHQWRKAQSLLSADETEKILNEEKVSSETAAKVRALILKKNFPKDPDSQILEDADCLAFLELKLENYVDEWEKEGKIAKILIGTLEKMTPKARELALTLNYSEKTVRLIQSALKELSF